MSSRLLHFSSWRICDSYLFVLFTALLLFRLCLFDTQAFNHLGPDTLEYIAFAEDIISGELFSARPLDQIPLGAIIRAPGFPSVLSLGIMIAPDDLRTSLLLSHTLLLTVATMLAVYLSKGFRLIFIVCLTPSLFKMREFFYALTSEWTAFVLLILLFPLLVRFLETRSVRYFLAIGAIASCAALTRPALAPIVIIPVYIGLQLPSYSLAKRALLSTVSISLLLVWMTFNAYRLGTFSIAPLGGTSLFCIGSLLGHAPLLNQDSETSKEFFRALNEQTTPASDEELARETQLAVHSDLTRHYIANYLVGHQIAKRMGIDRVAADRMLFTYGIRSIQAHFAKYLRHLYYGTSNIMSGWYLLLPTLLVPLLWLRKGLHCALSRATLAMLFIHVSHLAFILLSQPLISRYYALTYYALFFVALVVSFTYAVELILSTATQSSDEIGTRTN